MSVDIVTHICEVTYTYTYVNLHALAMLRVSEEVERKNTTIVIKSI